MNTYVTSIEKNLKEVVDENNYEIETLKKKVNFNEMIITERNQEIEKIYKDIKDIHEIFKDLSAMINEQSEPIIQIEENINQTVKTTEKAVETLKIAESYHKKWFTKSNIFILMSIAGLTINAPITVLYGVKAGVISSLSTIGVTALTTLFTKKK